MPPVISIIVPCFNSADFLPETLESVLAQTFRNWECIIINDGSTDNTEDIANRYSLRDKRIRVVNTPDVGLSASRNAGISVANGFYILPLDGDDKIHENYIQEGVAALQANPELKIVYCDAEFFGDKTGKWELPPFNLKTFLVHNVIFCSALFKRQDWILAGGYDESLKTGFEDWEFWISLLSSGGTVLQLPFIGFYYRIRGNSLTQKMVSNAFWETRNYVIKKHYDFFASNLGDLITLYVENESYKSRFEKIRSMLPFKLYRKLKRMVKR